MGGNQRLELRGQQGEVSGIVEHVDVAAAHVEGVTSHDQLLRLARAFGPAFSIARTTLSIS
jgi:hypothetical protein